MKCFVCDSSRLSLPTDTSLRLYVTFRQIIKTVTEIMLLVIISGAGVIIVQYIRFPFPFILEIGGNYTYRPL